MILSAPDCRTGTCTVCSPGHGKARLGSESSVCRSLHRRTVCLPGLRNCIWRCCNTGQHHHFHRCHLCLGQCNHRTSHRSCRDRHHLRSCRRDLLFDQNLQVEVRRQCRQCWGLEGRAGQRTWTLWRDRRSLFLRTLCRRGTHPVPGTQRWRQWRFRGTLHFDSRPTGLTSSPNGSNPMNCSLHPCCFRWS